MSCCCWWCRSSCLPPWPPAGHGGRSCRTGSPPSRTYPWRACRDLPLASISPWNAWPLRPPAGPGQGGAVRGDGIDHDVDRPATDGIGEGHRDEGGRWRNWSICSDCPMAVRSTAARASCRSGSAWSTAGRTGGWQAGRRRPGGRETGGVLSFVSLGVRGLVWSCRISRRSRLLPSRHEAVSSRAGACRSARTRPCPISPATVRKTRRWATFSQAEGYGFSVSAIFVTDMDWGAGRGKVGRTGLPEQGGPRKKSRPAPQEGWPAGSGRGRKPSSVHPLGRTVISLGWLSPATSSSLPAA